MHLPLYLCTQNSSSPLAYAGAGNPISATATTSRPTPTRPKAFLTLTSETTGDHEPGQARPRPSSPAHATIRAGSAPRGTVSGAGGIPRPGTEPTVKGL